MEYFKIALSAFISIAVLYVLTRIMGSRQITELSVYDYVNSITIGSIASEMATADNINSFLKALIATTVYALITVLLARLSLINPKLRALVNGRSKLLFSNGKFHKKNMKSAKIDINEFLMAARYESIFSPSEIEIAVMEPNGKINFLKKSGSMPPPADVLGIKLQKSSMPYVIAMDGEVLEDNLKRSGHSKTELENALKLNGKKLSETFLICADNNGKFDIFISD